MKRCVSILLLAFAGCAKPSADLRAQSSIGTASVLVAGMSAAQPELVSLPYIQHQSWAWSYENNNANFTPEFDVEVTTNLIDWTLQIRTLATNAEWDSPYWAQWVRVGAHWITNN